jgi:hypothetical protein
MAKIKLFRLFVGILEMPVILGVSFAAAVAWYGLLTGQLTARQRALKVAEVRNEKAEIFAFVAAVILGLGVGVFLMELNTHEMVRAFWSVWPASREDD